MDKPWVAFVVLSTIFRVVFCLNNYSYSLYKTLLNVSDTLSSIPPNGTVRITVNQLPIRLSSYSSQQHLLQVYLHIILTWRDSRLQWNPADYGGLDLTVLSNSDVWTPAIQIFPVVIEDKMCKRTNEIRIVPNGQVTWAFNMCPFVVCGQDDYHMYNFPFDNFLCSYSIGPLSSNDGRITINSFDNGSLLSLYSANSQWGLAAIAQSVLDCVLPESSSVNASCLTTVLTLQRRYLLPLVFQVLPLTILQFVAVCQFLVPAAGLEKMAFGMFVVMALQMNTSLFYYSGNAGQLSALDIALILIQLQIIVQQMAEVVILRIFYGGCHDNVCPMNYFTRKYVLGNLIWLFHGRKHILSESDYAGYMRIKLATTTILNDEDFDDVADGYITLDKLVERNERAKAEFFITTYAPNDLDNQGYNKGVSKSLGEGLSTGIRRDLDKMIRLHKVNTSGMENTSASLVSVRSETRSEQESLHSIVQKTVVTKTDLKEELLLYNILKKLEALELLAAEKSRDAFVRRLWRLLATLLDRVFFWLFFVYSVSVWIFIYSKAAYTKDILI